MEKEYPNSVSLYESSSEASSYQPLVSEITSHLSEISERESSTPNISEILSLSGYSNEVLRLHLDNGQSLIVKKSRYKWAGPRFESARKATTLLHRESSVIAPEHISLTDDAINKPTLAYWFIPMPTLKYLWPDLSPDQRKSAVRSLGRLLRKVHQVKVDQYGSLGSEGHSRNSISSFMKHDLRERMKPAIWGHWPDARPLVNHLVDMAAKLPDDGEEISLAHNDLHLGNILCETDDEKVRCVGLLDWEASGGGRPESDLASAIVLHDPLFAEESGKGDWEENFGQYLLEGYEENPDPDLLRFFKGYHLLNLGFFSALSGDDWHARQVAESIRGLLHLT